MGSGVDPSRRCTKQRLVGVGGPMPHAQVDRRHCSQPAVDANTTKELGFVRWGAQPLSLSFFAVLGQLPDRHHTTPRPMRPPTGPLSDPRSTPSIAPPLARAQSNSLQMFRYSVFPQGDLGMTIGTTARFWQSPGPALAHGVARHIAASYVASLRGGCDRLARLARRPPWATLVRAALGRVSGRWQDSRLVLQACVGRRLAPDTRKGDVLGQAIHGLGAWQPWPSIGRHVPPLSSSIFSSMHQH